MTDATNSAAAKALIATVSGSLAIRAHDPLTRQAVLATALQAVLIEMCASGSDDSDAEGEAILGGLASTVGWYLSFLDDPDQTGRAMAFLSRASVLAAVAHKNMREAEDMAEAKKVAVH